MELKYYLIACCVFFVMMFGGLAYSEGKKYEAIQACYQVGNSVEMCNKLK